MSELVKCSQCERSINSADSFCDYCGAKQGESVGSGMLDVESERKISSLGDVVAENSQCEVCVSAPDEASPVLEKEHPVSGGTSSVKQSELLPVTVLWNSARKFVENTTLPFSMRVTPERELEELEVALTSDAAGIDGLSKNVGHCASGKDLRIDMPFKALAGSAGEIPFDIYLRFKHDDRITVLHGLSIHSIYREEQAPQAVHYHANTTVKTGDGDANDQNVSVNNAGMADLPPRNKKALWEEINKEEQWEPLELVEVEEFPELDVMCSGGVTVEDENRSLHRRDFATESTEAQRGEAGLIASLFFRQDYPSSPTATPWHGRIYRIVVSLILAVGVVVLGSFLWGGRKEPVVPAPVQVNVIQQVGGGDQVAVIEEPAVATLGVVESGKPDAGSEELKRNMSDRESAANHKAVATVEPEKSLTDGEASVAPPVRVDVKQQVVVNSLDNKDSEVTSGKVVAPQSKPDPGDLDELLAVAGEKKNTSTATSVVTTPSAAGGDKIQAERKDFEVELELLGSRTEFVEGEKLQYRIRSERDCYVALLCYQVDGTTVVLFPNLWNSDSYIRGGRDYLVPDANSGFEIEVSPPFGEDRVELIACTGRSAFHRMLGGYATVTTRGMPFSIVSKSEVDEAVTRGMKVVPRDDDKKVKWFRESLTVQTKEK